MDITAAAASPLTTPSASSALTKNFDTFLTLLTTQLRNQDPLNPLDTEKFTEQLVQFSSVEESIKTNAHLETLIALQAGVRRTEALSLVGATAAIETDVAALEGGAATWTYSLAEPAANIEFIVTDAAGAPVAALTGDPGGDHDLFWNGRMANGAAAPDGVYRLTATATNAAGEPVAIAISAKHRITGAAFEDGATRVETAAGLFDLDRVKRVTLTEGA